MMDSRKCFTFNSEESSYPNQHVPNIFTELHRPIRSKDISVWLLRKKGKENDFFNSLLFWL